MGTGTTLVVGATGQVGGAVAQALLTRGDDVRILLREGSDGSALSAAGAHAVRGDLKDHASLPPVVEGCRAVITTANSAQRQPPDTPDTVDHEGTIALIDAAAAAGVERFVHVSAQGADPASPVPFLAAKGAAEQHLRASAMDWTVLSCDVFMDVWVPLWVLGPLQQGQPVRLVGEARRRHSFVASTNVADYAVAALDVDAARRATLLVGGPEALTWRDVVAEVERVRGAPVPVEQIAADQPPAGLPPEIAGLLLGMETYDSPPPVPPDEARRTYGVTLTSLADWLAFSLR